jgi:hypothetical protein
MKNLLDYDQFLNEANEVIKAQGACKAAIFQIQKDVDKFYKSLLDKDLIKSYVSRVKPYNAGYELTIDAKVDYSKAKDHDNKALIEFVFNLVSNNNSISIQPNTFFESDLADGLGAAQLEGTSLSIFDPKSNYSNKYPIYGIYNKKEIDKAAKFFVEHVKGQIADLEKEIVKLSK